MTDIATPPPVQEKKPIVDPLISQGVDEKSYSRPNNITLTQREIESGFAEPTYQVPPGKTQGVQEPFNDRQNGQPKKDPPKAIMPEMENLGDEEKEKAAEMLAESIMDGYEWVHGIGNNFLMISDRKIRKLVADGLDVNVAIPWTNGEFVPFIDFVNEYNETAKSTLYVDPKFRKKVLPPLTRVLKKRGAGMTDEGYLLIMFGQDLSVKAGMVFQMRSQMKDSVRMAYDMMEAYKNGMQKPKAGGIPQPPVNQAPPPPPPPMQQHYEEPGSVRPTMTAVPASYIEPGERPVQQDPEILMRLPGAGNNFVEMPHDESLPQFGDQSTLSKLDDIISKNERLSNRRNRGALKNQRAQNKADKKAGIPGKKGRPRKNKLGI